MELVHGDGRAEGNETTGMAMYLRSANLERRRRRSRQWRCVLPLGVHFLLLCASIEHVDADDALFVISRDGASPPRLCVNGPSDLLDRSHCIHLMQGDGALAGSWFNDVPQFATLKLDGAIRSRLRLRTGHRLALRLIRVDEGLTIAEPSSFKTVLAAPDDTYEFATDEFGAITINMIPRGEEARRYQATFQFVDRAALHADSAPFTLCLEVDLVSELIRNFASAASHAPSPGSRLAMAAAGWLVVRSVTPTTTPSAIRDTHGHAHDPAPTFEVPIDYRAAIEQLRARVHAVDTWVASRKYALLPPELATTRLLATHIPRLSKQKDSGVPGAEFGKLVDASAAVMETCDVMIGSAKLSDAIAVQEYYKALAAALDVFETYVPRTYRCPMGCEGIKSYPTATRCPACKMQLSDTRAHMDHQPKHGGTFFMAPDYQHHLEGVLVRPKDFRVYVYDEFTRPISAEGLSARAEAWTSGDDDSHPLVLRLSDQRDFLIGPVPSTLGYPVRIKLFVDFRDGAGPQVFDFEFAEPFSQ